MDKIINIFSKVVPPLGDPRWKVFFISLVGQVIISSLLYLGVKVPKFLDFLILTKPLTETSAELNSQPLPQPSILEQIKPKLKDKTNDFKLQTSQNFVTNVEASDDYNQASSYIVIDDATGKILAQKNSDQREPIASLTKIMTAVVGLDLSSPDETFTISPEAGQVPPTTIGVVPGQKMTLQELLDGALMTSANDAAEGIRDGINQKYNDNIFTSAMNEKAQILGLSDTHFANPEGFDDPGNFSTASDVAILAHYALENYPTINQIVNQDYLFLPATSAHKQFDLYNWNGLLDVYPGIKGVKIGNTDKAGYTTVVVSEREGKKVLVVLLGAPGVMERDLWAGELLDLGFSKLGVAPVNITPAELQAKYSTWKYW